MIKNKINLNHLYKDKQKKSKRNGKSTLMLTLKHSVKRGR